LGEPLGSCPDPVGLFVGFRGNVVGGLMLVSCIGEVLSRSGHVVGLRGLRLLDLSLRVAFRLSLLTDGGLRLGLFGSSPLRILLSTYRSFHRCGTGIDGVAFLGTFPLRVDGLATSLLRLGIGNRLDAVGVLAL